METPVGQIDGISESIVGYSDETIVGSPVATMISVLGDAVGEEVSSPAVGSNVVGWILNLVGIVVVVTEVGEPVATTILVVGKVVGEAVVA